MSAPENETAVKPKKKRPVRTPEVRVRDTDSMRRRRVENYEHVRVIEKKAQERRKERLGPEALKAIRKEHNLRYQYGMSLAQFQAMQLEQNNGCAICGGPPGNKFNFHVDHNHTTGEIRGLPCHTCNQGMIAFDRVPGWGEKAISYASKKRST